jgi:hypothetical protein
MSVQATYIRFAFYWIQLDDFTFGQILRMQAMYLLFRADNVGGSKETPKPVKPAVIPVPKPVKSTASNGVKPANVKKPSKK